MWTRLYRGRGHTQRGVDVDTWRGRPFERPPFNMKEDRSWTHGAAGPCQDACTMAGGDDDDAAIMMRREGGGQ
jgi:hypothetical protein